LSFIEVVNNHLSNGLLPIRSSVSRVEERLTKFGYVASPSFVAQVGTSRDHDQRTEKSAVVCKYCHLRTVKCR